MNKLQTHNEINKLIKIYEKRVNKCNEIVETLNESAADEANLLENEISIYEEFIDDLKFLLKENDE